MDKTAVSIKTLQKAIIELNSGGNRYSRLYSIPGLTVGEAIAEGKRSVRQSELFLDAAIKKIHRRFLKRTAPTLMRTPEFSKEYIEHAGGAFKPLEFYDAKKFPKFYYKGTKTGSYDLFDRFVGRHGLNKYAVSGKSVVEALTKAHTNLVSTGISSEHAAKVLSTHSNRAVKKGKNLKDLIAKKT